MNLTSLALIATAVINFLLALVISGKKKPRASNMFYSLLTLSISGWALCMYFFRIAPDFSGILLWGRAVYILAGAVPFFFLMFAVFFPHNKRTANYFWITLFAVISLVFVFCSLLGNFIILGPQRIGDTNGLVYNWGNTFYGVYVLGYFLLGFALLVKKVRHTDGLIKSQLELIITGAAITLFISFINNVILTFLGDFRYNWLGPTSTLIMVGFIGYAISRYRLMDIKTIIKKSSVFALLVLVITAILVLLSTLVVSFFDKFFQADYFWLSGIITALAITILFQPVKNILEKITDKFLFIKAYSSSELLVKTNQIISSTIVLNNLLRSVSESLEKAFHCSRTAFVLVDKSGKSQQLKIYFQNGFDLKVLERFAQGKVAVLPWYFSDNHEIKVIDELKERYEANEYQPKSVELLYGLYDLNISLVVPLFTKEGLIGLILLGNKKSGDPYTNEDLKVLNVIAGQLAMATENARLYEEQKNFNIHLKDEVKKATSKLVSANKELQRLDDAKSEFLSIASHQLRTPTTVIKGYISMIQEGSFGKVSPLIKDSLNKVYLSTERLLNLIENLLDISRIEAGRLEFDIKPTDLAAVAKALIEDFQTKANMKKLKLEFYAPKGLPKVLADGNKVKEVASNLIDNSVKYTNKGTVTVSLHQEGSSVVFNCLDTGLGIEPDDLPRLFNKFVRGKGMMQVHTEGTGLGLYFARVVIENMGGRIWAESPGKGQGSKFSFSLPLADKSKVQKIK
ncbi:MAG: ATP-binding protein [Patescibacteria group bacterium]